MERISSSAGRETSSIASITVLPASPDAAEIHQMFTQRNRVADILCDKISLYTAAMQFTDKHYLTKIPVS
jgi:hypothetical protein